MLNITQLGHRYPGAAAPALDALTLSVPAGSVYGLLGPNGAGKTTLISLLAGLLHCQQGRIDVGTMDLASARAADPRAIALVPQDYAFYPMLTVRENLEFFAGVLGFERAEQGRRSEQAIAFARLEQVVGQRAETLSGGLRRRLNLAIGLLGSPRLLLLDEPTVGVDPQSRHFLLEAIAGLPAAGTTVIYTSHYMEEVEAICQRLAILDQGKVLAEGALDDLLAGDAQILECELAAMLPEALRIELGAESTGGTGYRLTLPDPAGLPALLERLNQPAHALRRMNLGRQNLEQLFMRLTRRSLRD